MFSRGFSLLRPASGNKYCDNLPRATYLVDGVLALLSVHFRDVDDLNNRIITLSNLVQKPAGALICTFMT